MPRSAAGKEARAKRLSAAAAWKQGHVGGRGKLKVRGGGYPTKYDGGGGGGGKSTWNGNNGRRGGEGGGGGVGVGSDDPRRLRRDVDDGDDASDDDELDPVAAIGAGDAYEALLKSLRTSSEGVDFPRDEDGASSSSSEEEEEEMADDDEGEEEETPMDDGSGSDAADVDASGSDDEEGPAEGAGSGAARPRRERPGGDEDDVADAEDGDEEDEIVSEGDDDGDGRGAGGGARNRIGEVPDVAGAVGNHNLARHLARVLRPEIVEATGGGGACPAPKYRPAGGAAGGKHSKGKGREGGDEKKGGRWECDQIATADAAASSGGAEVRFPVVSPAAVPSAPLGLPVKLKTRWNALYDPAPAGKTAKKAKKAGGKKAETTEAEKADALTAPAAAFSSALQAELHSLLDQYRDVIYTNRAPPGSTPKQRVNDDGTGGGGDEVMDAYLLHVLSHVMRTRQRITKNNEALLKRAKAAAAAKDAEKSAERAAAAETAAAEAGPRVEGGVKAKAKGGKRGGDSEGKSTSQKQRGKGPNRVKVEDDLPRDQGFVRPTVLILVPMRNVAGRVVRRLLQLCPAAHGRSDAVNKLERFEEDFGAGDSDEEDGGGGDGGGGKKRKKGNLWVPDDHTQLFRGNTDDHFRLGIKITKASVRLYVDFFGSDILVASPLGLVTKIQESGAAATDFLSALEVIIVDHADVIMMQNWQHVQTVLDSCNALPKETHGTDIMRVHESHLNGMARHLRQTVVLSSFPSAEVNALSRNQCHNVAGRVRWKEAFSGVLGWAAKSVQNAGGLRQQFERLPDCSVARHVPHDTHERLAVPRVRNEPYRQDVDDARFKHFVKRVLPKLRENPQPGALVFVRSYFDFVRVRNLLTAEDVSFAVTSEYTPPRDAARARSIFADGRKRVLLVTERAHFFFRRRIRNVREVHFYSLPEHAGYYAELLGFLGADEAAAGSAAVAAPSSSAVFSRVDALQLERVVGTARARKMLAPDAPSTFMFVA